MQRMRLALGLVLAGSLALTGCVKSKILVSVKPDGSGYVVLTQLTPSPDGVRFSRGESDNLSDKLQKVAERFGEGVTLAKSESVKGKGFAAVFAFTNVAALNIPIVALGPLAEMGDGDMEHAPAFVRQSIQFEFARTNASCLTVLMPAALTAALAQPAETNAPPARASRRASQEGGMLEEMAGLEIDVAVEVKGQLLQQNAAHAETNHPNRFLLFQIRGDRLAQNPAAVASMSEGPSDMGDMDAFMGKFLQFSGATIETNRPMTLRFQ